MKYNHLITGEKCTLYSLFSKDNVVIIPDLQRDYCWGTKTDEKELTRDFVKNIVNNGFNAKSDLSLGLIYGYEAPIGHIQLCDGQQRITTLFLLLGLLNNKTKNNEFKNQLISQFELEHDDKEPYLQYSIRESSLYFLSDLVCHFFIAENDIAVSDINSHLSWYFKDYDLDPSIQNMISALAIIEEEIKDVDASALGRYLINELSFMYYDMGTRANGEETFVVINTTGEPLTATENLKPLFIDAQKPENQKYCSEKWEVWETWFWKKRAGAGKKENDTADNGFREFLRWITLLNTTDEPTFKRIQESGLFDFDINFEFTEIEKYFETVHFLFEESNIFHRNSDWLSPDKNDNDRNSQIVWFRLLPVIEYVKKFGKEDTRSIIRVKTFFKNLSRIDNVSKAVGSLLPEVIKIINNMTSHDIAEIINLTNTSSQILTEEEKTKFNIYLTNPEKRTEIEDAFWKAEKHVVLKGEILSLINWSTIDTIFDFELFKKIDEVFCHLFHDNLEYPELDITRRALLTRDLKDYPRKFKGYTNTSFCWEYSDWQILIRDNEAKFGTFLKELITVSTIDAQLKKMIDENPPEKDWDEFVKTPELLAYCKQKNIQYSDHGWLLVKNQKTSGEFAVLSVYRLYLDMIENPFWNQKIWSINFYGTTGVCIYFDHNQKNVAIDLILDSNKKYKIEVFRREVNSEKAQSDLIPLAEKFKLNWNGIRYESKLIDKEDTIEFIKQVQQFDFQF